MKKMSFEQFAVSTARNERIREKGITIYVRRTYGHRHNADFELATFSADQPGNGALTAFMNKYGEKYTFYVENILEDRLVGFFQKRGYRIIGEHIDDPDRCMISEQCHHFKDDIPARNMSF
jgi:hypothetical protein